MTDARGPSPRLEDLAGLWTRSLLVTPDGRRDETTDVAWLQGPTLFVDLRVPAGRPSFGGARRLRDLTEAQTAWLARQEGFAGRLASDGQFFEWRRAIDFQPATGAADAGSLEPDGDMLVERGRDAPYVEHWRRGSAQGDAPVAACALRDLNDGRAGILTRVGAVFMLARDRLETSPRGAALSDLVAAAPDLRAAQDLVDLELSIGAVARDGAWRIGRSSLPYREGRDLAVTLDAARGEVRTADASPDGRDVVRRWSIERAEGDLAAFGRAGDGA